MGYQQFNLAAPGPHLLAVSWTAPTDTDGKADLNKIMDTSKLTSVDATGDVMGDYINTWEVGSGWSKTYYYINQPAFNYEDEETKQLVDYTDTWMDADWVPGCKLDPGQAFWFYPKASIVGFTFSGQVAQAAPTFTLTSGPNLIANPVSAVLDLADESQVVITGKTSVDSTGDVMGDYINTWVVGSGWSTTYYYINQPSFNYVDDETKQLVDYTDTWMDADWVPGGTAISAGAGFWYYAKSAGVQFQF